MSLTLPKARSCLLFLQTHNVDFNDESVALFKGEHLNNPEMPGKTVPTLVVTSPPGGDGKKRYICQSTTILRYLATHHTKEGHWYTGSDDIRFKVDEFFDYWQGSLNPSFIKTMRQKYFYKMALKQSEPKEEAVKEAAEDYKKSLNFVKTYFFKGADFLCGDQISIADLLLASSLEQGKLVDEAFIIGEWGDYIKRVSGATKGYDQLQSEAAKLPATLKEFGLM